MLWYYTPPALRYTEYFTPAATVYDWMEDIIPVKSGSAELRDRHRQLLARSDLVFTRRMEGLRDLSWKVCGPRWTGCSSACSTRGAPRGLRRHRPPEDERDRLKALQ